MSPTSPDFFIAVLTIYREARNQSRLAKQGVYRVLHNRGVDPRSRWPKTIRDVALQPFAFSSYNIAQPAHPAMRTDANAFVWPHSVDPVWDDCVAAATDEIADIDSGAPDPTDGAVYYFSPPITEAPAVWGPVSVVAKLDSLTFCK